MWMNQQPNICHTIANGVTGVAASVASISVGYMEHIEYWARFSTTILGFIIAVITLRNLLKHKRK